MAITDFASLKTAIADYAARSDITSGNLANFVTLSEAIFNYGHGRPDSSSYIPPLRVRDMETGPSAVTVTSSLGALPAGFLEAIKVQTDASPATDLEYLPPDAYQSYYPSGDSTLPKFYTVIGSNIFVSANIKLTYYTAITTITGSDAGVNWLLTKSPGVYLEAALFQLYVYMKDAEQAVQHRANLLSYMGGLGATDMFSRAGTFVRRAGMTAF